MKQIGIIASDSTESTARVIVFEGKEKETSVEDLVLIKNMGGEEIIGVIREGLGINEALKAGEYRPGVAYTKKGGVPSSSREVFDFKIFSIGKIGDRLEQNLKVIAPRSEVYTFDRDENPMKYLSKGLEEVAYIGYYAGHKTWRIPVNVAFIPYHIGVFASTGGGKSYLARHVLIPLLRELKYDVIVFDWKGRDYSPYFEGNTIGLKDIAIDASVAADYLLDKMSFFGISSYRDSNALINAFKEYMEDLEWRNLGFEDFKADLKSKVEKVLSEDESRYAKSYLRKLERSLRRLKEADFLEVCGRKESKDIIAEAHEKHLLVINMVKAASPQKLSIFLSIAKYLKERMEGDENVNLALLIDEAPQYAPFQPKGLQEDTTEIIKDLCALGRSYGLVIILLSQGIAGDIGINAAVRRNLNTQFFGSIHPLDIEEASKWLTPYGVKIEFLLRLPPGHFYFAGKMNPAPMPLLMSFELKG